MILLLLALLPPSAIQDGAAPIPPLTELKKAEAEIRGLFEAEWERADRESRGALARRLVQEGTTAANAPALRYSALSLARDLAIQGMDLKTALAAVDAQRATFKIGKPPLSGASFRSDDKAARVLALNDAQKYVLTPRDVSELGEAYLTEADTALKEENYEDATACSRLAERYAKAAKALSVQEKAAGLLKDIPERKKESEAFEKLLDSKADDPPAKLIKGRYLLFVAGDEALGLEALAESSDERVKKAAALEAGKPADVGGRVEAADAWIAASDKESSALHKRRYFERGLKWLHEAQKAAEGLEAVRVEKRIEELSARGGMRVAWTDLLALVDPKRHARKGEWELSGGAVFCASGQFAQLELPYEPPDEYDLRAVVDVPAATEPVLLCVFRGRPFAVSLYVGNGKVTIHHSGPPIDSRKAALPPGRPARVLIQVRLKSISVTVNDVLCHEWMPEPDTVAPNNFWVPRNPKALGLGLHGPKATFTRLQIVDITGRGKRRQ